MAEATIGGSILSKIQAEAYKSKEAGEHHESLSQKLSGMLMGTDDMKTAFVKAAEDEAAAQIEKSKKDESEAKIKEANDEIAAKQRIQAMSNFEQLGNVLKTNANKLGSALKEDFNQLTAGFQMLASTPGMRSIIALITAIGTTLGSLLLINIKNSGILGKTISGLIGQDKDGKFSMGETIKNVKDKFNPMTPWNKDKKVKTKKDGSKDMRFNENQPLLTKMNKSFKKGLTSMGKSLNKLVPPGIMDGFKKSMNGLGKSLSKLVPTKMLNGVKKGAAALGNGIKAIGKGFLNIGKKLIMGAIRMGISAATLVAGMLATAASVLISGIIMLAPAILIGIAVMALIFGIMYLRDKFIENKDMIMARWEVIKEGFKIALDGLVIWKDKAVTFISNTFKGIWLSIKSLFSSIYSGIENGINAVIRGINVLIPGEKYDLDPVDIGAGAMAREVDEENAAFEVEKQSQADEFAKRQSDLDDRKTNNTMERGMQIVQSNNTVNEGTSQTNVSPSGTSPLDTNASNMALAQ
jgi:hypothetical protein